MSLRFSQIHYNEYNTTKGILSLRQKIIPIMDFSKKYSLMGQNLPNNNKTPSNQPNQDNAILREPSLLSKKDGHKKREHR